LPARADAVAKVRHSLRRNCPALPGHLLYDAELLTSEIVSNVVKHAGGMVTVGIECDGRNLAVTVADESPKEPVLRGPASTEIGGRGMQIVDRLAAQWGSNRLADGTGKVVWFRLAA
jgi:anti-sigma regulatory factor (Ser/Thr protein kinase)